MDQLEDRSKASSSVPPPPPPWIELPPEITSDILLRLGALEILNTAQKVCATWWKVSKDPAIWRSINMSFLTDEDGSHRSVKDLEILCRLMVDGGHGQVIDIKLTSLFIESADLIGYIAVRSNQLRCLSLEFCTSNDEAPINSLTEAVKKLPLLEEIHLDVVHASIYFCGELIETAGNSCPLLKSFSLSQRRLSRFRHGFVPNRTLSDDVALAVAKWLPELRHLGLVGDLMTNEGLEAILGGCTYLESLDLRRCSQLMLDGELGTRCSQQIHDLRLGEDDVIDTSSEDISRGYDPSEFDDYDSDKPDWYYWDEGYC